MHPPSLTASSGAGPRLSRAVRTTNTITTTTTNTTTTTTLLPSHKLTDTPATVWIAYWSRLRLLRALLAYQPSLDKPPTPDRCSSRAVRSRVHVVGSALLLGRRSALVGLPTTCTCASWWLPRRHASGGRRPTFHEVSEALDVLGVTIDEDGKSLKKKYRELVKKNHPDAGGDAAVMAKVTVAYDRLSTLTTREKEEYKVQKKMYGGGSGSSGSGSGSRRYRPGPPGGYGFAAPGGPFNARAANMYGQYYQQDANTAYQQSQSGGQQSYWNQFHNRTGTSGFSDNPFNFTNPFSMSAQAQRARLLPTGTLLIQGLVIYLVFSACFLFIYRRYRDWSHDDGWRMSESLARHEQMQEMHRLRQELNERARAMLLRDGGDGGGGSSDSPAMFPGPGGAFGMRQHVGESPEARALEYARQRRIQMMQEQQEAAANAPELKGWPQVGEDKGRIIKRAQDPPGVVFFEPRREDMRRRQIDNQRRASGFTRRAGDTPPPAASPGESAEAAAAAVASADGASSSPAAAAAASGNVTHLPLPPETNVSSIVMKPVGNDQEAQAVMRGIFSGLRRGSS